MSSRYLAAHFLFSSLKSSLVPFKRDRTCKVHTVCWRGKRFIPEHLSSIRARAAVHPIHLFYSSPFFCQEIYRRFLCEKKIGDLSEIFLETFIGDLSETFIGDLSETFIGDLSEISIIRQ